MKKTGHITFQATVASLAALLLLSAGCQPGEELASEARIFAGSGNYQRVITTDLATAHQRFNQAMQLTHGFNHDEAIRSF